VQQHVPEQAEGVAGEGFGALTEDRHEVSALQGADGRREVRQSQVLLDGLCAAVQARTEERGGPVMDCSVKPCSEDVVALVYYSPRKDAPPLRLCVDHLNRALDLADEGRWGEPRLIQYEADWFVRWLQTHMPPWHWSRRTLVRRGTEPYGGLARRLIALEHPRLGARP
jgi:hypothetical protein